MSCPVCKRTNAHAPDCRVRPQQTKGYHCSDKTCVGSMVKAWYNIDAAGTRRCLGCGGEVKRRRQ